MRSVTASTAGFARRPLTPVAVTLAMAVGGAALAAPGSAGSAGPGIALAFAAGLASFLSPCVLPLLPSFISALSVNDRPVRGALAFSAGFSIVFMVLGASASALGALLVAYRPLVATAGGLFILAFGLVLLGVLRAPFLMREYRAGAGNAPLIVVGAAFAAGWTPCIGPILGAILGVAGAQASVASGVLLLAVYSLGLAVPFVAAAAGWGWLSIRWRGAGRWPLIIERLSGALLVAVGALMLSGRYTAISSALVSLTPAWLRAVL